MPKNIVVVSHRRSGTHLTIDSIKNNFPIYKDTAHHIKPLTLDRLNSRYHSTVSLQEFTRNLWLSPHVFKTHAHSDIENFFENCPSNLEFIKNLFSSSKIIYVYRDGRDVMNSLYHYVQSYNDEMKNVSFSEFIRMENNFDSNTYDKKLNRAEYWKFHVSSWLSKENVLYLSFEEFLGDYDQSIKKIADFAELDYPRKILRVVRKPVSKNKIFKRLYNRIHNTILGVDYSSIGFRKGKSGDFVNSFNQEDLDYFYSIAGTLMQNLKYDKG